MSALGIAATLKLSSGKLHSLRFARFETLH